MGIENNDEFKKVIDRYAEKLTELEGKPLSELLTPSFISSCSKFHSYDDMLVQSGVKVESDEDFKEEWNKFIAENTTYSNWESMLEAAIEVWMKSR